jgi:hypothetical protein
MKKRRILFYILFACFISLVGILSLQAVNNLNERLSKLVNEENSEIKINFQKFHFFNYDHKSGIIFQNILISDKETNDSIFSSKQIAIYLNNEKQSINKSIALLLKSPTLHVYQDKDFSEEKNISTELEKDISINDFPEINISNLEIIIHDSDTTIRRIHGIHIRGKKKNKKYLIQSKYKIKDEESTLLCSVLLSGDNKNFHIDSAYISVDDTRLVNFELDLRNYNRSKTEYFWRIHNNINGENCIPYYVTSGDSHIKYDISGLANDHEQITKGFFNSDLLFTKNNTHSAINYNISIIDSTTISSSIFSVQKGDKKLFLSTERQISPNNKLFSMDYISNLESKNINIGKGNNINGIFSGNYHIKLKDKNPTYISGNYLNTILLNYDGTDFKIKQENKKFGSEINISSSKAGFDAKISVINFIRSTLYSNGFNIDTYLNINKIQLALNNKSSNIKSLNIKQQNKNRISSSIKNSKFHFTISIDSILNEDKLLSKENNLLLDYNKGSFFASTSQTLTGNFKGKIESNSQTKNGIYEGKIFSKGIEITNQNKIPFISNNIKLTQSATSITDFEIPFKLDKDHIEIASSVLRSNEFLISISGKIKPEEQNITLGLSAQTSRFKGASNFIVNTKTQNKSGEISTILLLLKRKNGKFDIKTDVISN